MGGGIEWMKGQKRVDMNGKFTSEQLKAIAFWMER